jgi:hypothetical protein
MNTDEKILKMLEDLQTGQKALQEGQKNLEAGQKALQADVQKQGKQIDMLVDTAGHMNTALKSVATKQDVEVAVDAAKSELKADILMLDSKVVKRIQSLDRRVTNIEEREGIENPEKN